MVFIRKAFFVTSYHIQILFCPLEWCSHRIPGETKNWHGED